MQKLAFWTIHQFEAAAWFQHTLDGRTFTQPSSLPACSSMKLHLTNDWSECVEVARDVDA